MVDTVVSMVYSGVITTRKGTTMATMTTDEIKVCVFCECEATLMAVGAHEVAICPVCRDYKGIMTVPEYEAYTGNCWMEEVEEDGDE